MLTLDQIRRHLADANLQRVAARSRLHPATVYRALKPDSKPAYETVKALSDYVQEQIQNMEPVTNG